MTDEQVKAFRLADNKVSEMSTWDYSLLSLELPTIDFEMKQFGFEDVDDVDLDSFFEDISGTKEETIEDKNTIICPYCGKEFTT